MEMQKANVIKEYPHLIRFDREAEGRAIPGDVIPMGPRSADWGGSKVEAGWKQGRSKVEAEEKGREILVVRF